MIYPRRISTPLSRLEERRREHALVGRWDRVLLVDEEIRKLKAKEHDRMLEGSKG